MEWYKLPPDFWEKCYQLAMLIGDTESADHYLRMMKMMGDIERAGR